MKLFCNPLFICKLVIWQTIWLLSFNVSGQQANKPLFIHMSGLNFPGAIQFDRKGAFDLFIANLNKQASINMQYDVLLPARGARLFYQKKADCVMPAAFYPPYYEGYDVIASKGYAYVDYVAFTLAENGKITDKSQLEGKLIGTVRGEGQWDLKKRFDIKNAKYVELVDERAMLGMLVRGRIDVIIHDSTIMIDTLNRFNVDGVVYDKSSPIVKDDLTIVCHKNPRTLEYLQRVNPLIQTMLDTSGLF